MHIPDGFLGNALSAPLIGAAAVSAGFSISKLKSKLLKKGLIKRKKMALAGGDLDSSTEKKWQLTRKGRNLLIKMVSVGIVIFAAQLFDFSVGIGTGHFIGTALAAIVLGPFAGILVMSIILALQAFFMADGGIIALGANIFNMAVAGTLVSYLVFTKWRSIFGIFLAGWFSVVVMSLLFSVLLMISGNGGFEILTEMVSVHMIIGIGEGLLTALIVRIFFPQILK